MPMYLTNIITYINGLLMSVKYDLSSTFKKLSLWISWNGLAFLSKNRLKYMNITLVKMYSV